MSPSFNKKFSMSKIHLSKIHIDEGRTFRFLLGVAITFGVILLLGIPFSVGDNSEDATKSNVGDIEMMGSMMDGSHEMMSSDGMTKMMSDPSMQGHMEQCLKMMEGMTEEEMLQHMKMCEMMMQMMS